MAVVVYWHRDGWWKRFWERGDGDSYADSQGLNKEGIPTQVGSILAGGKTMVDVLKCAHYGQ